MLHLFFCDKGFVVVAPFKQSQRGRETVERDDTKGHDFGCLTFQTKLVLTGSRSLSLKEQT